MAANMIGVHKRIIALVSDFITIDNHRQILSGVLDQGKAELYFDCIEDIYYGYLDCILKRKSNRHVLSDFRKLVYIYSMTSKLNNNLLWENYAAHYTGFCIEYSIPQIGFFYDPKILHLFPVIYKRKIPFIEATNFNFKETSAETINQFRQIYGTSIFMQLLYKHIDYKFEHEWRIIVTDLKTSLQSFPYVSRIIAGKDIKPRNLSRLRKIAQNLGVPIGHQVFDETQNKFRYINE